MEVEDAQYGLLVEDEMREDDAFGKALLDAIVAATVGSSATVLAWDSYAAVLGLDTNAKYF